MPEKKRILIVDDEEAFGIMVKFNLEEIGDYEVRAETKGRRAMAAIKEFKPDLVFLDIIMPDLSGVDVFTEIKGYVESHSIPVVFLTAIVNDKDVAAKMGSIGGRTFLAKPITTEKLIACIQDQTGG
ncbi:MAG: response regulator [Candidatus Omnitrophota bacterium]